MAWKEVSYRLTGSAPLIMHNGQTADPTNKWSKAIKKISSKRNKTDADYEEMARLEFLAGLYLNKDGPVIPAKLIDAVVLNGAKKSKEGMIARSGCYAKEHAVLEYEGPRDTDGLWQDENFRFSAIVSVQRARILRMRPIFNDWAAMITLNIEDTLVDTEQMDRWIQAGGQQVGIGDWRPVYGRFQAERLNGK